MFYTGTLHSYNLVYSHSMVLQANKLDNASTTFKKEQVSYI